MSKKYYKEAFATDEVPYNKRKLEKSSISEPFQLNNYSYYEPKLESDFYIKYFTKELLFEIDILELNSFLQYHFENCENTTLYLSILELKIIPKTKEIIQNAEAFLETGNSYYNEIALDDGFSETEGVIKNSKYEYSQMFHYAGFLNLQNDLEKRYELIISFLKGLNNVSNGDVLNWNGKPTHLAYIISQLLVQEYIEAPLKNDGEINYTELSKQIQNSFNFNSKKPSIETLRRYANIESEKSLTLNDNFKNEGFHLPNSKIIS